MPEDPWDEVAERMRAEFNTPPETPRDEMWAVIEAGLAARNKDSVVSLDAARRERAGRVWSRPAGWAAAAAAVLIIGIGIGRMSAPVPTGMPASGERAAAAPSGMALRMAASEHLDRTESLLTLVRADARSGELDPAVGTWARSLLTRTRLLLDADEVGGPAMEELLEDLELILLQIVGATEIGGDPARARTELDLALDGLEDREVLPRIQAVSPAGTVLAGT